MDTLSGAVVASFAGTAGALVFAALGSVVAAFAVFQFVLAVAAVFYRGSEPAAAIAAPRSRVVVLVPAHDEAALIARCVRSLRTQTYPADLYDVVVIADNCTDDTAAIARSAGAEVLVRNQPDERGKGRALHWAMNQLMARTPGPDAIVVVDADSVAVPEFLATLVRPFEGGAAAVQGESLLSEEGSPGAALRAAAFLLVNRARPAGRAVLGLPSHLAGNGMLFSRELLRAHPLDAFTSAEDVEYTIKLRLAGVRPVFAGGATVHSPAAPTAEAAAHQQLRWEGGKLHVARTQLPRLVVEALRRRQPSLLEAAFELAMPPLGLLTAAAIVGTVIGRLLVWAHVIPGWSLVPWLAAGGAIPLYVVIGLAAARAPASSYRALAGAPLFVLTKIVRAYRLFGFRADTWVRTERAPNDRE